MNIRYHFFLSFFCLTTIHLQAIIFIIQEKLDDNSEQLLTDFKQMRLYHLHNQTMKTLLHTTIIYSYLQAHNLFNKYNKEKEADSDTEIVLKNIFKNAQYEIDGVLRNILGDFKNRLNYICVNHNTRLLGLSGFRVTCKKGNFADEATACNLGSALKHMIEQFPEICDENKIKDDDYNTLVIDWLVEKCKDLKS